MLPPPPDQVEALLEIVAASMEMLNGILNEGKIVAGGVPAGQKKHAFIVDAESNDKVTELVQSGGRASFPSKQLTQHLCFCADRTV